MTATKLFNVRENRYEYVGDDQLDSALRSASYRLPAGSTIRMLDAEGNAYDADNRTNFADLSDFRFETNYLKENRERLERAAEQPLLAAGAAALRGATFGLSDVAAAALGIADEVKALKEANPVASTMGEIGGTIASAIALPGGGLVGGAAKAGQVTASLAERALASSVVKGAAEVGATTLSKDIAKRVAHKALTSGAGGFVEGSLYGLGQTMSEAALGDPKEAAEHLISNVGFSGLLNGSFMSVGGAFSALTRKLPPGVSEAEAKATLESVGSFKSALNQTVKETEEQIAKTPELASKAGELIAQSISKILPVSDETAGYLKSAFSDPATGKMYLDFLDNAPEAIQKVSETMERMVRTTEQASKFLAVQGRRESIARMPTQYAQNVEAGAELASRTLKDIDSTIKELTSKKNKGLYDSGIARELKKVRDDFEQKIFKTTLAEVEREAVGAMGEKVLKKGLAKEVQPMFESNVDLMNSMNDVWRSIFDKKKFYSDRVRSAMTSKDIRSEDILENLYTKVVDNTFNEKVFGPQVAQENREISKLIAEQIGVFKSFKDKFYTESFINGQKTEIFDPDKFSKFIKSDEAKRILQNDIFETYMVTSANTLKAAQKFNIQDALFKEASGVVDETITAIREMKELKAAVQAIASLEAHTGKATQKTLLMSILGSSLGGPMGAAVSGAIGYTLDNPVQTLRFVNRAQQQIIDNKSFINRSLEKFMGMPKATAQSVAELSDFTPVKRPGLQGFSVPKVLKLGAIQAMEADSKEPLSLEQVLVQPTETTVERVTAMHTQLNGVLPNVSTQMGAQTYNAVEFLKSKMPKDPTTRYDVMPLSKEYVIPPVQRAKFERYVEAINDPATAIAKLSDGTMTAEHVEALQAVYPALYAETQRTVLEMLAQKPKLTFRQKVQLGLFMQAPTMPAYDPTIFASIQGQYALAGAEEGQKGMKVPQDLGQSLTPGFQQALTR